MHEEHTIGRVTGRPASVRKRGVMSVHEPQESTLERVPLTFGRLVVALRALKDPVTIRVLSGYGMDSSINIATNYTDHDYDRVRKWAFGCWALAEARGHL